MRRIDLKKANVARSNTIRDINRQIVLNYVRERGPISRAEIAHETALQRSTVSLIVEELRIEGLIEEVSGESTADPAVTSHGRRRCHRCGFRNEPNYRRHQRLSRTCVATGIV